eukprot:CAMPEP_0174305282 /NCGR_PEP_ID=MMETSP0809-20121228/61313_1 /TAXON_ID=73025 ORGANISM="Eutreptiella gymnastica-like, Strain CCMP1594" /NCGR_SAMPLE_ID=MMETSP0809 /ASSEMBLY_ACC=CAM_ASM_000658 /LENGTH=78 /DNA_ID=CAMNT_0015411723 /DNA_START=1509 /DNA_END=1745 /DNA_ORIENTATION=-
MRVALYAFLQAPQWHDEPCLSKSDHRRNESAVPALQMHVQEAGTTRRGVEYIAAEKQRWVRYEKHSKYNSQQVECLQK